MILARSYFVSRAFIVVCSFLVSCRGGVFVVWVVRGGSWRRRPSRALTVVVIVVVVIQHLPVMRCCVVS